MQPEDLLKYLNDPKVTIDTGTLLTKLLQQMIYNKYCGHAILQNQLEVKELLKGNVSSDVDIEHILDKFDAIEDQIDEIANEEFLDVMAQFIME